LTTAVFEVSGSNSTSVLVRCRSKLCEPIDTNSEHGSAPSPEGEMESGIECLTTYATHFKDNTLGQDYEVGELTGGNFEIELG